MTRSLVLILALSAVEVWAAKPKTLPSAPLKSQSTPTTAAVNLEDVTLALRLPLENRLAALRDLGARGEEQLRVMAFAGDQSLELRWRAITAMGRLGPQKFRAILEKALQSSEWFMRNAALVAIVHDERTYALDWSEKLLTDRALVVRTAAVQNILRLRGVEKESALWREVFSKHNFRGENSLWVRHHLARALASFAQPGREKKFAQLLSDNDSRLHAWAIEGLRKSTGVDVADAREPLAVQREKWLAWVQKQAIRNL